MGSLSNIVQTVIGVQMTDWALIQNMKDPGLAIAGRPITPDGCYVELYLESLRLAKARKFATKFNGVVYSFVSMAREGSAPVEIASVTKPRNLSELNHKNLDRVITISKRLVGAMPWRGDPLSLELGLFSVKNGNLISPLTDYIVRVSEKVGVAPISQSKTFLPLIFEGLELLSGQVGDTEIELAIDSDMSLTESQIFALVALPKQEVDKASLSIDTSDRKLLTNGSPLDVGYCVFSIRQRKDNPNWGAIPDLRQSYSDFLTAIDSGKHKEAEEALAGFNRQVMISPDLISADQRKLKKKAADKLKSAFPGGGQSSKADERKKIASEDLWDLDLYGKRLTEQESSTE